MKMKIPERMTGETSVGIIIDPSEIIPKWILLRAVECFFF